MPTQKKIEPIDWDYAGIDYYAGKIERMSEMISVITERINELIEVVNQLSQQHEKCEKCKDNV